MIFNIQRFSTHDGPGIRTVVFLKGCPLHCPWCENPEGQAYREELFYDERLCIGCLDCLAVSRRGEIALACSTPGDDGSGPARAGRPAGWPLSSPGDRSAQDGSVEDRGRESGRPSADPVRRPLFHRARVKAAGRYRAVCPANALTVVGEERSVEEIVAEVEKDRPFYGASGGVTLSGGEPFAQPRFLLELARELCRRRIDVAIETSLQVPWRVIEPALPFLSLVLADLKHVDAARYHDATGGDLSEVLANFAHLQAAKVAVVVRVPVIPGFNDRELAAIIRHAALLRKVRELHLLPYHDLGRGKLELLGRDDPMGDLRGTDELSPCSPEGLAPFVKVAQAEGLTCIIGG